MGFRGYDDYDSAPKKTSLKEGKGAGFAANSIACFKEAENRHECHDSSP